MATAPLDVLVVDDSVDLTATLADMLRISGHHVRRAHGFAEALKQLESGAPDVLVTDIFMSDGNGIELLQVARGRHPLLRCVTMSGGGGEFCRIKDSEVRAREAGSSVHLLKPFTMHEIVSAVEAAPAERVA